jgi:pimeloyl-ACP methyl ester carboxylesterase
VTRRLAVALLLLAALLAACRPGGEVRQQPSRPSPPPPRGAGSWVCHPGPDDAACTTGLDAVAVTRSGTAVQPFVPDPAPRVDCFYLYPTVSRARGTNAPRAAEPAVVATVRAQAAALGAACRVFAPEYRQVTLEALASGQYLDPAAQQTAYGDVVEAWHAYLEENPGRPVVLVGHSQGAMLLARLLADDVAQQPEVRAGVVSALLLGGGVTVPDGSDVADHAGALPACRRPGQTRCLVAYSSFLAEPPPDALFGRAAPGRTAVCTDPTVLAGGTRHSLHPLVPTDRLGPVGGLGVALPAPPGTAAGFVAYPGALTATCVQQDGASWLQVAPVPGSALPATLLAAAAADLSPQWGLHTVDVTVALGDLVEVVRRQAAAWPG